MDKAKTRQQMTDLDSCAVIVAHPNDETLWAGGTILLHPEARWTIITPFRSQNQDLAEKFLKTIDYLSASGGIGSLQAEAQQLQVREPQIQKEVLSLLPPRRFDLIITHSMWGESTRHQRQDRLAKAVLALWKVGELPAKEIRMFAYEDGNGQYLPRPMSDADVQIRLPEEIWQKKYEIITKIYGFQPDSFEAKTAPRQEAFWRFTADAKTKRRPS